MLCDDHFSDSLRKLRWLPIGNRIPYKLCTLMCIVYNGKAPVYISKLVNTFAISRLLVVVFTAHLYLIILCQDCEIKSASASFQMSDLPLGIDCVDLLLLNNIQNIFLILLLMSTSCTAVRDVLLICALKCFMTIMMTVMIFWLLKLQTKYTSIAYIYSLHFR